MSKWLKQIVAGLQVLLYPRRDECLLCKQIGTLQSNELGLCQACMTRIPWIREVRCIVCGRAEICSDCLRRKQSYFVKSRSAVRYDDTMKELLARYKYRGDERLRQVMGYMLYYAYQTLCNEYEARPGSYAAASSPNRIITYVPVSERRLQERGFNQAEQMAHELGRRADLPVVPLLLRSRHTDKQSFKKRSERLDDLEQVFETYLDGLKELVRITDSALIVYLIDDVYTTGSTMNQCAKVLKEGLGAEVFGITWAR